jgi:hypothetical protein
MCFWMERGMAGPDAHDGHFRRGSASGGRLQQHLFPLRDTLERATTHLRTYYPQRKQKTHLPLHLYPVHQHAPSVLNAMAHLADDHHGGEEGA